MKSYQHGCLDKAQQVEQKWTWEGQEGRWGDYVTVSQLNKLKGENING